jgi:glycerate kinase
MPPAGRLKEIEIVVACDVETAFVDAAKVFGPQKGASAAQVKLLTRRLERLVQVYRDQYGVDVSQVRGAGAAGGLAGGLVAVGARIESGFDVLAEAARLDERLVGADLVITGEGLLDDESFNGKVVGGVASWAAAEGVPVLAVVGAARPGVELPGNVSLVSLTERFGDEASWSRPLELAGEVSADAVRSLGLAG